jgi:hypothetical protein
MMFAGLRSRWTIPFWWAAEALRDLLDDVERRRHRHRAHLGQPLLQRLPLEQLHHDEEVAALEADVVHLHDVRMLQLRDRPRLEEQPLDHLGVVRHRRQQLHRDVAVEADVLRLVDGAHRAAADQLDDLAAARFHPDGRSRALSARPAERGRDADARVLLHYGEPRTPSAGHFAFPCQPLRTLYFSAQGRGRP